MSQPQYVCGCVEQYGDGTPALKLPTSRPLVYIQDALPAYSKDEIWAWIKEAYARWASVCDWKGERIANLQDAGGRIVHLITVADLGGSGVLADQVLPYNGGDVYRMRINSRIRWKATDGRMDSGTVDPLRTITHEVGHFHGHQHWPVGGDPELMEPTVSQTIIKPQPTEAKVSAAWFGPPNSNDRPPPIPNAGVISIDLAKKVASLPAGWTAKAA